MKLFNRPFFGPALAGVAILALVLADGWYEMKPAMAFADISPIPIAQTPLAVSTPVHPQVLILLGNSQSMDGDLSGAIHTGSGALAVGDATLANSSSPTSYTVPAGFTPPKNAGTSGVAPFTTSSGGTLYDNGPSRLNVAKQGISAVLTSYLQNTDFGLEIYNANATSFYVYTTWVYYMSPTGGFTFTNSATDLGTKGATETVLNPCYNYTSSSANVLANCAQIALNSALNYGSALSGDQYMQVAASSDDAAINDVLYDGATNNIFIDYNNGGGGPNPASPYTGTFCGNQVGLTAYKDGCVLESYSSVIPNNGVNATGPTNAGYVPFSPQVMYALRGFGYYNTASSNSGTIAVTLAQGNAGASPTTATVAAAQAYFTPYLAPETNNGSSSEIKALAVQSPLAGLLATAKTTLAASTSSAQCNLQQYVILISDGLPTEDLQGNSWPPLGSTAAAGYGVTATFNTDGSLNTTNDQALTDTVNAITALKANGVKTYVVGLGAGVDPAANPTAANTLTALATAGGTGSYIAATTPAALVSGLSNILSSIQAGLVSTTSVAVSSTNLQAGELEFQSSFNPNTQPYSDWTGDLIASTLNTATGQPNTPPSWDAQALLDSAAGGTGYSTRAIATWNPSPPPVAGVVTPKGVGFAWANLDAAQQALLQPSDTLGSNRVLYLRGDTALEVRNGGAFRNRTHILGDIVDSQPLLVTTGSASSPTQMVYVGANDGMLHAFLATTGVEQFAYVPNGVIANLSLLSAPLYNQGHHFFVDGSPNAGTVTFADNSVHTVLVGGENGGGMSIYGIDVTNPTAMTTDANVASKVLWEFSDATDLGYTYSQPQIAKIAATPGYAVIFGNGYDSSGNSSVMYFINPQTGALIKKINLCTAVVNAVSPCYSGIANGLSTVAVGQTDGLQGVPITTVYAGDLQGNLWAVDVSDATPSNWTVRLLFQTQRNSGWTYGSTTAPTSVQPITTPPVVTLNPSYPNLPGLFVMFGTGQLLASSDLTNSTTQSVYGVYDRITSPPTAASAFQMLTRGTGTGTSKTTLVKQTLTYEPISATAGNSAVSILTGTNNPVNLANSGGWYDDLLTGGQEVITNPALLYGGFITTLNTPPGSNCGGTFASMFLELNFATGGTFSLPQLDINGSGTITSADVYTTTSGGTTTVQNPVGVGVNSTSYGSAPSLLGKSGNGYQLKSITQAGGSQDVITDPNNAPSRSSWWQIK